MKKYAVVHDLKLDMLEELVDELNGEPLLVGYEFQSDLARLQQRFGKMFPDGKVPYLGKGTTATQEDQWVAAWNRGGLPLMFAHPASAGHGINLQEGQACNVAWFSVCWDWDSYDQFIRRVRRSGNHNAQVFNHILAVKHTIDDEKLAAVREKDFTERRLTVALNNEILRDSQDQPRTGDTDMVAKLSRPDNAASPPSGGWGAPAPQQASQEQQAQPQTTQQNPAGWGAAVGPDPNADQRQRIQEQVAPQPDRAAEAAAAFSGVVVQQRETITQQDYGSVGTQSVDRPAQGGWGSPAPAQPQAAQAPFDPAPAQQQAPEPASDDKPLSKMNKAELLEHVKTMESGGSDGGEATIIAARAQVLGAVITSSPDLTAEDIVSTARDMMDFVLRG